VVDDMARLLHQCNSRATVILAYTKTQNGYAVLSFKNPFWVWFLIHESVSTVL